MAEKQVVFQDEDQIFLERVLIDRDKEEALKYLNQLLNCLKSHPGGACSFRDVK